MTSRREVLIASLACLRLQGQQAGPFVAKQSDRPHCARKGRIGVQLPVGGPMKVEYRNWRIRPL